MRRFLLLLNITLLGCTLFAQLQRGVKGDYDVSQYPEVSFVWNSPNPVVLEKDLFTLTDENGQNLDFDFSVLPQEKTTYKKSILFLWEDMNSHSKQSENTRKLLLDFFKTTPFDQSTLFNVAVFNRKSDLEKNVLKPLLTHFSANKEELTSKVAEYEKSTRFFKDYPKSTDLYAAIDEGVNILKKESDRIGIIVVVTAGLNMKASGASTDIGQVLHDANETGIPVYVVKYPQFAGNVLDVDNLARSTYGQTLLLMDNKVDATVKELQNIYKNFDANCYGQDYKLSFTTTAPRDGKPHRLSLSVNKAKRPIPPFTAPSMTFGIWIKEHVLQFILLTLLLVGLIAVAVWFIVRSVKKFKEREAKNKAQLQHEIDKANQERANWMNMQKQKEEAKLREDAQKAREAEENRLLQLMHTKNLYPRLQCNVAGTSYTYTIGQIVTKLGRDASNDVVLSHHTVSGFHAEIRFNGTSFEAINRSQSYKRGIIVNGQFFQQCTLKNGDMIGLGEAVISFFL